MIDDILQTIVNYSKPKSQIYISQIDRHTYITIYIYVLDVSRYGYFDQSMLEQEKFKKLKVLDCTGNKKINSVNHLKDTLERLHCGDSPILKFGYRIQCGIDQNGISQLEKLKVLHCTGNKDIHNINHLKDTLEELYCGNCSGISQSGISELIKIKKLYCNHSENIYDVNHLCNTLEELDCSSFLNHIKQDGIDKLKHIKKLICSCNCSITDVSHLADTLEELHCGNWDRWNSGIDQKNIEKLKKIRILICNNNYNINNVNHFVDTLEILDCSGNSGIDQNGISKLKNMKKLYYSDNNKINYVSRMSIRRNKSK